MRLLLLGGLLLGFCQCTPSKSVNYKNPQRVARAYYQALAQQDFERLLRLGTPEMQGTINLLRNMQQLMPEEERQAALDNPALKAVKKITCVIQENTAVCKACCDEAGEELSAPLTLKKINKQWLIHWEAPTLEW
ncbi:MAG: hypothetical protein ACRBFS_15280 [Aureispira sp.]